MRITSNPPNEYLWGPDCTCSYENCPCQVEGTAFFSIASFHRVLCLTCLCKPQFSSDFVWLRYHFSDLGVKFPIFSLTFVALPLLPLLPLSLISLKTYLRPFICHFVVIKFSKNTLLKNWKLNWPYH